VSEANAAIRAGVMWRGRRGIVPPEFGPARPTPPRRRPQPSPRVRRRDRVRSGRERGDGARGADAPLVVLKQQAEPCDTHGEAYEPIAVDVVLEREEATLRGPDGFALEAPTAGELVVHAVVKAYVSIVLALLFFDLRAQGST
jgi:hypothetical protein